SDPRGSAQRDAAAERGGGTMIAKRPARKNRDPLWLRLLPFAAVVIFLAAWEAVVRFNDVPPIILPAPSSIARYLVAMIVDGTLPYNLLVTFLRIMAGFLVAAVFG